ncbi:MAG TPA: SDR family NAD(P)-dependent oxidoreductase [Jatrophihabitans sp.]
MADWTSRGVVVCGAAGALGTALTVDFAGRGATVIAVDGLLPTADRQVPNVEYAQLDLSDESAVANFFTGRDVPWAVVNTVGGYAPNGPLTELDIAELNRQIELNLTTAALITKYALRRMIEVGEGRIVHTASKAALSTHDNGLPYSLSKLGVMHLVTMAAEEVHGTGITVNCVMPSIMDTPANRAAMPAAEHARWPAVADVAEVYAFLASPQAGLVSGAAIPVYGRS